MSPIFHLTSTILHFLETTEVIVYCPPTPSTNSLILPSSLNLDFVQCVPREMDSNLSSWSGPDWSKGNRIPNCQWLVKKWTFESILVREMRFFTTLKREVTQKAFLKEACTQVTTGSPHLMQGGPALGWNWHYGQPSTAQHSNGMETMWGLGSNNAAEDQTDQAWATCRLPNYL